MRLVVVESPLKGIVPASIPSWLAPFIERVERERNRHYAFACIRRELENGRAPYASHALFDQPGLLDDASPGEREMGIQAGQDWSAAGDYRLVFQDRGTSTGMQYGIMRAREHNQDFFCRKLLGYRPLSTWRCVLAVVLRWMLAKAYR